MAIRESVIPLLSTTYIEGIETRAQRKEVTWSTCLEVTLVLGSEGRADISAREEGHRQRGQRE